ncbi:MAG: ATP-binding cassette domain-containing protein [Deltaproteobacteria bacterium]|nr:ATP-binding cassette domain-containing protein [Deltaproteobacteria bacterium]
MNMEQPVLAVKNLLVKRGGATVLDIDAFSVNRGEVVGLIGPNGAGKSTLLLAMSKLLKAKRGNMYFKGNDIESGNGAFAYRRMLSMVFQEPLLFDTTVYNNIASGLKIRGMASSGIRKTVMEHLNRFGISHLAKRSARKLSGGEAQRTSLARAFATGPEIIFLDEPFSSLDPPTREALMDDLQRNLQEAGATAVMATHDQMEALRLADRIAVMNQGRIVQMGPPEEVINQPVDEFVASFVGTETILRGKLIKTGEGTFTIAVSGHEIEAVGTGQIGETVVCCIRPEHVTISANPPGSATSSRNSFRGRIVKISRSGFFYKISMDCGFPLVAYITSSSLENLMLKEETQVFAAVKATAIHVIKHSPSMGS